MNEALLQEGAASFGLALDAVAIERFGRYLDELRRWNRSINLTAITKPDQIVIKHFVDSLSIVPHLASGERVLDVGSGAGLPGLVAAIMRDDIGITSLDAVDKKVRFQRHICRTLELGQVTVLHGRVEQLAEKEPGRYDLVTSRAFRDIERFAELSYRLVRPGGRLLAMLSGDDDRLDELLPRISQQFGLQHLKSELYKLPQGAGRRRLVLIRRNLSD